MKNVIRKVKMLLGFFVVLTLISILTLTLTHQTPIEKNQTTILCTYKSKATYDYTAILKPNMIYNNKTILKPGEGPIYTKITKKVNLTLTFNFESSLPAETEITYSLKAILETSAWTYQLYSIPSTKTNHIPITIELNPINKTELDAIKNRLDSETGVTSTQYTLQIYPTFIIEANTTEGTINQIFNPTLTVEFEKTEKGQVILIENLNQAKSGSLTRTETIILQEVINQRYASYILSAASITGLAISTYLYARNRPPPTLENKLEKILSSHKDLIVETVQQSLPRESKIISVNSMDDIRKISEILAKPILLIKEPKPTLIVIDQNIVYKYKISLEK